MPFEDYEVSVEASRPIELYDFSYQGGHLRYTSADRDIDFESNIWQAHPLDRGRLDDTGEIAKAALNLTASEDFPVSELFSVAPPDDVVGLVVRRLQAGDLITAPAIWLGRVLTVQWPPDRSEMRCESILSSLKMTGLRRPYGKNCPHVLYGNACKVDEIAFTEDATVTTQIGRSIVSSAFDARPDGYFAGGKITWEPSAGYFIRRGIKSHVGDTIEVTHPIPGLIGGSVLKAAPGCDHTFKGAAGCIEKFANGPNYGGFPFTPQKNPFGQNTVF